VAQGCDVLIAYRQTALPAEFFAAVPSLLAAVRCAVDIRTIDVVAAGREGILVTQASAGFGPAVAEWVIGAMIDLSRRISTAAAAYWQGQCPPPHMGCELRGACIGIIGYGEIGRHVARLAQAFGMRVCVYDPHVQPSDPAIESLGWHELLASADHVVCLATATPATEKLINARSLSCILSMHHGGSWWTSRACDGLWSGGNWQAPLWMWVARQTRCRPLNWRDIPASLPHRMSVVSHRKRLLTKPWKL
jgi:D-3-phosphoglycerate dehydrogenase